MTDINEAAADGVIVEIERATEMIAVRPGDTLVIIAPADIDDTFFDDVKKVINEASVRAVILSDGFKVKVIRAVE